MKTTFLSHWARELEEFLEFRQTNLTTSVAEAKDARTLTGLPFNTQSFHCKKQLLRG